MEEKVDFIFHRGGSVEIGIKNMSELNIDEIKKLISEGWTIEIKKAHIYYGTDL